MIRRIALVAIVALMAGLSAEAVRPLTRTEKDSVVNALATIWGEQLNKKAAKGGYSTKDPEYVRGLAEMLRNSESENAYYAGLEDGIVLDAGIKQIEQLGGFKVDRNALAKAFERVAKGRSLGYVPATAERYMDFIITAVTADDLVKARSQAFMDSIAKKPGVKTEMTGLMWEVIKQGEGPKLPMNATSATINYVGRLFDGTVFDDHNAERPTTFRPDEVIPGFAEGLYIVPVGGTYRIYLTPEIAYGEKGVTGVIPPNCALVFDITMLDYSAPDKK